MNLNLDKKKIVIIGSAVGALIFIIIIMILIVSLGSKNEKKRISYNMNTTESKNETTTNDVKKENTTNSKNETEKKSTITGEITYEEISDGIEIPIPPTFSYVEGNINDGAVIKDEDGNQFVWVPVENIEDYQRKMYANNGEKEESNSNSNDDTNTEEELNLKDENIYSDSVEKYKGFYIARYEAGKEDNNKLPVSKENVVPWTQVLWDAAKELAYTMYDENDYFQSDLVNSYAWDTTCNWIRSNNINIDDSTDYGNYQNSSDGMNRVVETGSNNRWKANNIYDMAGNAWEYTTEEYGTHEKYHIGRGGGYWNYGDLYPISTRGTSDDSSNLSIGFRVVLYLK